jgi:hypothetical protein
MVQSGEQATDPMQSQDPNAVYPLGSSQGESARLQRQADELAADSAALLDKVGLGPGQSAIDRRVCRRAAANRRGDHDRGRPEHRAAVRIL